MMNKISRRAFALGAGSIPLIHLAQALGESVQEQSDGRVAIIDCSEDTRPWIKQLKDQNVRVVARYLAREWQSIAAQKRIACNGNDYKCDGGHNYPGKGASEAQQLLNNNFALLSVYQYNSSSPAKFLFGLGQGAKPQIGPPSTNHVARARAEADLDANAAEAQSKAIGQPDSTPIYFGLDFDLRTGAGPARDLRGNSITYSDGTPVKNDTVVEACEAYFARLKERFGTERLGVYGNGFASQRLIGRKLIKYSWISESRSFYRTARFLRSGQWHLFQHQIDRSWFSDEKCQSVLELDGDIQNPNADDIGAWTASGRFFVDADRTRAIFGTRMVAKQNQVPIYVGKDESTGVIQKTQCKNGKREPANVVDRNRSVRVISDDGSWLYIDSDEDGVPDGFVRKSNFVSSIREMPDYYLDGRDQ